MKEGTLREWQTSLQEHRQDDLGDGPWQKEPDKRQWVDKVTGLACLMLRNPGLGHWCGYVGVPMKHPAYGKGYDDVQVDVHGGLTFADKCRHPTREMYEKYLERYKGAIPEAKRYPTGDASRFIREWKDHLSNYEDWAAVYQTKALCHIPEGDMPDNVWWLGFDCAHLGDLSPGTLRVYRRAGMPSSLDALDGETYKDVQYVEDEVTNLAYQLGKMI